MDNICTYHVKVKGEMEPADLSTSSPLKVAGVSVGSAATSFTIRTDQSGLIGMLRYLHGRGFILLSFARG